MNVSKTFTMTVCGVLSLDHVEIFLTFSPLSPAGRTITGWPDEESMNALNLNYSIDAVRVIFNNNFSYHLKFIWGGRIPRIKEYRDHSGNFPIRKIPFFFFFTVVISQKEAYVRAEVSQHIQTSNF